MEALNYIVDRNAYAEKNDTADITKLDAFIKKYEGNNKDRYQFAFRRETLAQLNPDEWKLQYDIFLGRRFEITDKLKKTEQFIDLKEIVVQENDRNNRKATTIADILKLLKLEGKSITNDSNLLEALRITAEFFKDQPSDKRKEHLAEIAEEYFKKGTKSEKKRQHPHIFNG